AGVQPRQAAQAREGTTEEQVSQHLPNNGDRASQTKTDAGGGDGKGVPGQRVADKAGRQRQAEQDDAKYPGQLAWFAVRACEKYAKRVQEERGDHDVRRPMVDVADEIGRGD